MTFREHSPLPRLQLIDSECTGNRDRTSPIRTEGWVDTALLYCVRTRDDILFRQELDELRGRLKNFHYDVTLSSPDTEWPGARGHISREFLSRNIPDLEGPCSSSVGLGHSWRP